MTMRAITTANLPDRQTISDGDLFADDHPFVRKYPQFFEDIESSADRPIERATAAPGERRRSTAPTPSKPAPAAPAPTEQAPAAPTTTPGKTPVKRDTPKRAPAKKSPAKKAPAKKAEDAS